MQSEGTFIKHQSLNPVRNLQSVLFSTSIENTDLTTTLNLFAMGFWTLIMIWVNANSAFATVATLVLICAILLLRSQSLEQHRLEILERDRVELLWDAARCLESISKFQQYLKQKRVAEQHCEEGRQARLSHIANMSGPFQCPAWNLQQLNNLLFDYEHVKHGISAHQEDVEWPLNHQIVWDFNRPEVEAIIAAVREEQALGNMLEGNKWRAMISTRS